MGIINYLMHRGTLDSELTGLFSFFPFLPSFLPSYRSVCSVTLEELNHMSGFLWYLLLKGGSSSKVSIHSPFLLPFPRLRALP